jgi:hypothetical protein
MTPAIDTVTDPAQSYYVSLFCLSIELGAGHPFSGEEAITERQAGSVSGCDECKLC